MNNPLSLDDLEKLNEAVGRNVYLNKLEGSHGSYRLAKDRISQIYAILDKDQRSLFASLISRYEIHNIYERYASFIADKVAILINFGAKVCIVTPYTESFDSPKSGSMFAYEVKSQLNGMGMRDGSFRVSNVIPTVIDKDVVYVMIDDFSGTGRTIARSISQMIFCGMRTDQISVQLIYAMDDAVRAISSIGISVSRQLGASKCISEFNNKDFGLPENTADIYKSIEVHVKVSNNYKFGYMASESLLSMKRTPNNTLPIFWEVKGAAGYWPAPFPR